MNRPTKFRSTPASKFGAKRTGRYSSKLEASYAADLENRQKAINGDVAYWLWQVPVYLQGDIRYVVDFLVFKRDGTHEYVETKGFETPTWKAKMKQLQEAHPEVFSRLTVVKRGG